MITTHRKITIPVEYGTITPGPLGNFMSDLGWIKQPQYFTAHCTLTNEEERLSTFSNAKWWLKLTGDTITSRERRLAYKGE